MKAVAKHVPDRSPGQPGQNKESSFESAARSVHDTIPGADYVTGGVTTTITNTTTFATNKTTTTTTTTTANTITTASPTTTTIPR